MCGIVGVVGLEACSETILDSLKRLEYRGYDSSGIVTQSLSLIHISEPTRLV